MAKRENEVTFVVGPYKSGTSLLAHHLANGGYWNPSTITNKDERAYGTSLSRYYTHECSLLRSINDSLMLNKTARQRVENRLCGRERAIGRAQDYLMLWSRSLVLKDPRLLYTLPFWVEAARRSGKRTIVYFTTRESGSLEEAWRAAPFTRGLLRYRIHHEMRDWASRQLKYCERASVTSGIYVLPEDLGSRRLGANSKISS